MRVSTMFPGLPLQYSIDGGITWIDVPSTGDVILAPGTEAVLIAR